jgi:hypothetical protein
VKREKIIKINNNNKTRIVQESKIDEMEAIYHMMLRIVKK